MIIVMYIDSSKMDSGTGPGVHSTNAPIELSVSLGVYTSIYQTEIFAVPKRVVTLLNGNIMEK